MVSRRAFLHRIGVVGAGTAGAVAWPALFSACVASPAAPSRPSASTAPPGLLKADGARLVDASGREVRLTGINWFGLETAIYAPHGLWTRSLPDMLDQIAATGFNAIRLPFSNELLQPSSVPTAIDFNKNPDLKGLNGLQLMDRVIEEAGHRNLVVVLDRHRPTADAQSELWYTDRVPEARWIDDWTMLATRYRQQPAVIGADLHNEPHGAATWGDGNLRTDWQLAAEHAGNAILNANPNWLIVVEGIERFGNDWYWWGGNLEGARDHPVRLSRQDKLVYSAHDYGPDVYPQTWFQAPDFPQNLPSLWHRHWAWLKTERVAPVLVGEFGGRSVGPDREGIWQRRLIDFLKTSGLSYTYWSWNPDSGDTGGILNDDWTSLNRAKLDVLATYQWPRLKQVAETRPVKDHDA